MEKRFETQRLNTRRYVQVLLILILLLGSSYSVQDTSAKTIVLQTQATNVALNKPAAQLSDFQDNFCLGEAALAVDDNTDGDWTHCSVTHTLREYQPWWEVDLQGIYQVSEITIWNRTDSDPDRLSNFIVSVSIDHDNWQNFPYAGMVVGSVTMQIDAEARYVKIQLQDTNFLSLAEVQVMGTPVYRLPFYGQFPITLGPDCKGKKAGDHTGTQAIDYALGIGIPVIAAGDGTIVYAGLWVPNKLKRSYGYTVQILHDDGLVSTYAHLSEIESWVILGVPVDQADFIGLSGDSGKATGPHLHFEIQRAAVLRNASDPYSGYRAGIGVPISNLPETVLYPTAQCPEGYTGYAIGPIN